MATDVTGRVGLPRSLGAMFGSVRGTAAVLAALVVVGVALTADGRPQEVSLTAGAGGGASVAEPSAQRRAGTVTTVVAVSIDGLNPAAVRDLGAEGTPTLHRMMRQGASTLNARTERELTLTLPNHAGMLTGRRVDRSRGGHGVTWNDDRRKPATVQEAAGHPVRSVFSVVDSRARDTGVFASKTKFGLFERSWPRAVDRSLIREDNARLVRRVRADIEDHDRAFRFVHLSLPDVAGHAHGFMGREYLAAVQEADRLLGRILAALESEPTLRGHTAVVVTADHGGRGEGHGDPTRFASYRVPFIVWGAGVARGADIYDLNPDYADPGRRRTTYAGRQPVRNGALANVVTDLLGLPAVRGSEHDAGQDLDWR